MPIKLGMGKYSQATKAQFIEKIGEIREFEFLWHKIGENLRKV